MKWTTAINLSVPRNKLLAFPGLEESPYAYSLVVGQPLSLLRGYKYTSVDAATGLYQFEDVDKDGTISYPNDYQPLGTLDPKFYGGWENNLQWGKINVSIMLEFRKQVGANYLGVSPYNVPGFMYNQSAEILNRWQKPGDLEEVQRYTQTYADTYASHSMLIASSHLYSDAPYVRVKTISCSYNIGSRASSAKGIRDCMIFLRGQNLVTITKYKAGDH